MAEDGGRDFSHDVTLALSDVYRAASALDRSGGRTSASMAEVFAQLDHVTTARRIRLDLASGFVPGVIWIALYLGGLLTIGFTLFFGSQNLPAQVSMTGVLSIGDDGIDGDHITRPSVYRPNSYSAGAVGHRTRRLQTAIRSSAIRRSLNCAASSLLAGLPIVPGQCNRHGR